MNCREVQSWISLYVDDALESENVGSMFAHLGSCADCQRFLRTTLKIRSSVNSDARFAPPESLEEHVMKRVEATDDEVGRRVDMLSIRISIPLPAAMAMAVMLIVGSMVFSPLFFDKPPTTQLSDEVLEQLPSSIRKQMEFTKMIIGN